MDIVLQFIEDEKYIEKILIKFKHCLLSLKSNNIDIKEQALKFSQKSVFLIILKNNKVLGFIAFYCNDFKNRISFLSMIAVLPEYSGNGYGHILMNEFIRISKEKGMSVLKLEVNKNNVNAISFYKKLGFKINDEMDNSFIMEYLIN